MLLTSTDGSLLGLEVVDYQFPPIVGTGAAGDWDANWLVVRGRVRLPDGTSWQFEDPCLTTWEAAALGRWLDDLATDQTADPVDDGAEAGTRLTFTEPDLAFGPATRDGDQVVLRVELSHEARSPARRRDGAGAQSLVLRTTPPALHAAAAAWRVDLGDHPVRGDPPTDRDGSVQG